jgi:hypothetical protein
VPTPFQGDVDAPERATGLAFLRPIPPLVFYPALLAWLLTFVGLARALTRCLASPNGAAGSRGRAPSHGERLGARAPESVVGTSPRSGASALEKTVRAREEFYGLA